MSKGKGKGKPVNGDRDDDVLEGTPRSDLLLGKKGSDVLIGKGGDDLLIGGKGMDTALYSGSFLDYKILTLGPVAIVHDLRGRSPDGTDMLLQIEQVQFADYTLFLDGRNNAPYAVADAAGTTEDEAIVVSRAQLLANDRDPDGNALSIVDVRLVSGAGSVALVEGNVAYDPGAAYQDLDAGETATVVLEYRVTDGRGAFDTAHITLTIQGLDDAAENEAPVAVDDAFSLDEDGVLSADVLLNDTDADLDGLRAVLESGPQHGTLALNANGTFTYTPDADFNGTDSFTYRANDGAEDSNPATVRIQVAAVNDAPVTAPDSNAAAEDGPAATGNVLDNDDDADASDELSVIPGTYTLVHGTLELGPQGHYSYVVTDQGLAAGDEFTDVFQYTVSDGTVSDTESLGIVVTGANDVPIAGDDTLPGPLGSAGPVAIAAAGLLANDHDIDRGTTLEVSSVSGVSELGAIVTLSGGEITYDASGVAVLDAVPTGGVMADWFEYTVSDGDGGFDTARVDLSVSGRMTVANNAPVAGHETFSTNAMYAADGSVVALSIPIALLLRNDFDPDGDALAFSGIQDVFGGSAEIVGDHIVFTPTPSFGIGAAPSSILESEPNNLLENADLVPRVAFGVAPSPEVGDDSLPRVSLVGAVEPPNEFEGDPDGFQFSLRAGETITVELLESGGPIFFGVYDHDQQLAPVFGGEGMDLVYTATADGTHTLAIDGFGSYRLNVSLDPVLRADPGSFRYALSDGRGGEAFGSVTLLPVFGSELNPSTAGSDFDNNFLGGALADVLQGGNGNDTLTGGGGSDRFEFFATDGFDVITDFQRGPGGDVLDLDGFPTGYAPGADLDQFVRFEDFGANSSRMLVDADGAAGGAFYQPVALLEGHTGLSASQLLADGNLLI